jgi:hypothetical protein
MLYRLPKIQREQDPDCAFVETPQVYNRATMASAIIKLEGIQGTNWDASVRALFL